MQQKVNFIDNKSILVVNPAGRLRKVNVPFQVFVRGSGSTNRQAYIVEEVLSNLMDEIVYFINNEYYLYHHFTIIIDF